MAYTTIDDSSAYFQTTLYTGDGAGSHAITNTGNSDLQPDWLWIKRRDGDVNHLLHDSVRGVTNLLVSNTTAGNDSNSNIVLGFDSDGFRVGANSASNGNNQIFVAWQWKADSAVSGNTLQGGSNSKTYAGRVNTTAGISIIQYVGNGIGGHEIPHNLSETPVFYIIKRLTNTEHWQVYHASNTSAPQTDYLQLSTNEATVDANTRWNDTAPGTNSIVVGSHASVNAEDDNYIAYIFSNKKGYSKFDTFLSNNDANNVFVYTGFAPSMVILKSTTSTNDWTIQDIKRPGANPAAKMYPNLNNDEDDDNDIDFLSNGFKIRGALGANTFVYMAWANNPFVTSTGISGTAR